ncbi:FAD-binding oxidoreductase [Aurantivibrio infirmus]
MNTGSIIAGLEAIVDDGRVLTDDDNLKFYGVDRTKKFEPNPLAIVFPRNLEQVQRIVLFANQHKLPLVPSGGRTGLSAGAVATNQEVVVAFDLMNKIEEFDPIACSVRCQAGVVTEQLQNFAEENHLFYPVDFASSGSSQLGGNISTNAGGIKVIRYGLTRQWVMGLTVVTGKGEVLRLNDKLVKNATGYDLRQLFIGAEGTLGFVVEATMRLTKIPQDPSVMVLATPSINSVMTLLAAFREKIKLNAFEVFSDKAMTIVTKVQNLQRPLAETSPYYVLLEFDNNETDDAAEAAMEIFESCLEQGLIVDGVISKSKAQAQSLWQLREFISESLSAYTPYKNDISVAVSKIPEFIHDIENVIRNENPDFEIVWFGHIGDGNLHLNILKPDRLDRDDFFCRCEQANEKVYALIEKFSGSISAEHGVGLLKKPYLHFSRSEAEIGYMRSIKQIFDPNNIMNPGKIF